MLYEGSLRDWLLLFFVVTGDFPAAIIDRDGNT